MRADAQREVPLWQDADETFLSSKHLAEEKVIGSLQAVGLADSTGEQAAKIKNS
jgi:hypothetical protein